MGDCINRFGIAVPGVTGRLFRNGLPLLSRTGVEFCPDLANAVMSELGTAEKVLKQVLSGSNATLSVIDASVRPSSSSGSTLSEDLGGDVPIDFVTAGEKFMADELSFIGDGRVELVTLVVF